MGTDVSYKYTFPLVIASKLFVCPFVFFLMLVSAFQAKAAIAAKVGSTLPSTGSGAGSSNGAQVPLSVDDTAFAFLCERIAQPLAQCIDACSAFVCVRYVNVNTIDLEALQPVTGPTAAPPPTVTPWPWVARQSFH